MATNGHATAGVRRPRGAAWLLVFGLTAMPAAALAEDVQPFTVSLPTVVGPIPSTETDFPHIALGFGEQPPLPEGYVEEEFFFSGTGNIYEYTPTGIQIVASCPPAATSGCTDIPYTTRMLVRRPIRPRDFSGTVIVEPLNPSGGFDIAAVWDRSVDHFVRSGDVFVGWTSKSVIVNALQRWNPGRYAALDWPYLPFVPNGNSGVNDGITFDIASQVGALFKHGGPGSPLPTSFEVQRVFEAGFSQDGGFTFTQASFFHRLARMPDGGQIYDGYVPMGTNGPSNINFGLTPAGALATTDPRRRMQPRDVPVMHVQTETEIALGALSPTGLAYRRDDSDAANDRYRLWEVPGASHVSADFSEPVINLQINSAQLQNIPVAALPPLGCTHQQFIPGPSRGVEGIVAPNNFPFRYVQNAAFRALTLWVELGVPPAHADRISVNFAATPRAIVRDERGNALGGVRTPFLDVPTATYFPFDTVSTPTPRSGFCILYGYNAPFDAEELASLYRNHGDYVSQVVRASVRLVREHLWLLPDAIEVIEQASHADVP